MLYLILGSILLISAFFTADKKIFNINLCLVFIYLSLDYYNGFDWINYYYSFSDQSVSDLLSPDYIAAVSSPGFSILLVICKILGAYTYIYLFSSALLVAALWICFHRSEYRNIALCAFFCFFAFDFYIEKIKQGFSISLVLLFVYFFYKGHKKSGWAVLGCAVLFHYSALLAVGLALFPYKEQKASRNEIFIGVLKLLSMLLGIFLVTKYGGAIVGEGNLIGHFLSRYSEQIVENFDISFLYKNTGIFLLGFSAYCFFLARKKPLLKEKNYAFLVILFMYFSNVFYGMNRIAAYYIPYFIDVNSRNLTRYSKRGWVKLGFLLLLSVQLIRPMMTPYYRDWIMDYQITGLTDRTIPEMKSIRCKSILTVDYHDDFGIATCAKDI